MQHNVSGISMYSSSKLVVCKMRRLLKILYVDSELSEDGRPLEFGLVLRSARRTLYAERIYVKWPDQPRLPNMVAGKVFADALGRKIEEVGVEPQSAAAALWEAVSSCDIMGFKSAPAELKAIEQLLRQCPVRACYFDIDHLLPPIRGSPGSVGEYVRRFRLAPDGEGAHDALWDASATALIAERCCALDDDGYPRIYSCAHFGKSLPGEELRVKNGMLRYASMTAGDLEPSSPFSAPATSAPAERSPTSGGNKKNHCLARNSRNKPCGMHSSHPDPAAETLRQGGMYCAHHAGNAASFPFLE